MTTTVTDRDDLELVSPEETLRGYEDDDVDTAVSLAAIADATDCIYFEGALPDREGGVVRVEFVDAGTVFTDLAETLPGFHVVGVEPLVFSPRAALEAADESGEIGADDLEGKPGRELVEDLRAQFRIDHQISHNVDQAMRMELRKGI